MKNLNHTATMAGVLGAGVLLILAAGPAVAGPYDGHPDLENSVLNDVDRPAYVGTGLSAPGAQLVIYPGQNSAFPNQDIDQTGFVTGKAGPEKGDGDLYGSILFDIGSLQ